MAESICIMTTRNPLDWLRGDARLGKMLCEDGRYVAWHNWRRKAH